MTKIVLAFVALWAGILSLPAHAADIGVVLMGGKWAPNSSGSPTGQLLRLIERSGFVADMPEMPWSRDRAYDRDVEGALVEIDRAVERLKKKGASRIVVGGQSLGANIAMAYAARRDGIVGILAVSPGHVPDSPQTRNALSADVARARSMIADGKGEARDKFLDINQGERKMLNLSVQIYLSWMDPDGAAVMSLNAAKIKPGTALLWMAGDKDGLTSAGPAYAFDKAPSNPKSAYVVIPGGTHKDTMQLGAPKIIEWLKAL